MTLLGDNNNSQDSGATGAAKTATSSVGNLVGGLGRTVGNVTGAAGRGVGDTVTGATGSADDVSKGVENAGQWKK
uniref:CsbD-like domain-containing protein n=1 Tax=Bionectria ochroleuca TaxID=29856 RepID=A0A0B7JHT4_BIOOC